MKPFTIGYAQKSAKELYETLERNGVRKVLDVRLKNTSGCTCLYALKRDFPFLLSLIGIGYEHKKIGPPRRGCWFEEVFRDTKRMVRTKRGAFENERGNTI